MRLWNVVTLGWLLMLVASVLFSDEPPIAQTTVPRAQATLRIDGVLDEPDWKAAPALELRDIKGQEAPKTTAQLLWDDRHLYVAFDCADTDVWATRKQRDDFDVWREEDVEVFIDPEGDGRDYYQFQVNPLGTRADLRFSDAVEGTKNTERSAEWNCKDWQVAVKVRGTVNQRADTDEGWTVEMAIPLSQLPCPASYAPRSGGEWRVNLHRIDRPKGRETAPLLLAWSKCEYRFHEPARFGRIVFGDKR